MKSLMMLLRIVRPIELAFILLLSGCGYFESKEKVVAWVKNSMQTEMRGAEAYKGIDIATVVLIREKFNKYTGYIEFRYGTDSQKEDIVLTMDGSQKLYKYSPPLALMTLRDKQQWEARVKAENRRDKMDASCKSAERQKAQVLAKEEFKTASDLAARAISDSENSDLMSATAGFEKAEKAFKTAETIAVNEALPAYRSAKGLWIKELSEQLRITPEKYLKRYAAPLWNMAQELAREAEDSKDVPIEAKCRYEEALRVLGEANALTKEKMEIPATFKIECNVPDFKIFEGNVLLISSNQQFAITPLKEHILEARAEGFRPKTLTITGAEPEADLGVKRINLLKVPPAGGDSNAVSWRVINEQWIENTYENGDVTMGDRRSGSMWMNYTARIGKNDWNSAVKLCDKLKYAGYSGWRLPEKEELLYVRKQIKSFYDVQACQDHACWSNSSEVSDPECAWAVCMVEGETANVSKSGRAYVWAVRNYK